MNKKDIANNKIIKKILNRILNGDTYDLIQFSIKNFDEIKKISYQEWLEILIEIKNNPIALYHYISFIKTMFSIDFYEVLIYLENIENETVDYIVKAKNENDFLTNFDEILNNIFTYTDHKTFKNNLENYKSTLMYNFLHSQKTIAIQ